MSSIFMGSEISTRIHLCRLEDTAAFFFKTLIGTMVLHGIRKPERYHLKVFYVGNN